METDETCVYTDDLVAFSYEGGKDPYAFEPSMRSASTPASRTRLAPYSASRMSFSMSVARKRRLSERRRFASSTVGRTSIDATTPRSGRTMRTESAWPGMFSYSTSRRDQ